MNFFLVRTPLWDFPCVCITHGDITCRPEPSPPEFFMTTAVATQQSSLMKARFFWLCRKPYFFTNVLGGINRGFKARINWRRFSNLRTDPPPPLWHLKNGLITIFTSPPSFGDSRHPPLRYQSKTDSALHPFQMCDQGFLHSPNHDSVTLLFSLQAIAYCPPVSTERTRTSL